LLAQPCQDSFSSTTFCDGPRGSERKSKVVPSSFGICACEYTRNAVEPGAYSQRPTMAALSAPSRTSYIAGSLIVPDDEAGDHPLAGSRLGHKSAR